MIGRPKFAYVIYNQNGNAIAGANDWEDAKKIADLFPKSQVIGFLRGF